MHQKKIIFIFITYFRPNPRHRRHDDDEVDYNRSASSQQQQQQQQQQHRNLPNTTSSLGRHSSNNFHNDDRHSNNGRRRHENDVHVSQTVVVQQQPRIAARHNMPLQPPQVSPLQPPKLPQKKRQRPEVTLKVVSLGFDKISVISKGQFHNCLDKVKYRLKLHRGYVKY